MANEARFQVKFVSDGAGGVRADIESMGKTASSTAAKVNAAATGNGKAVGDLAQKAAQLTGSMTGVDAGITSVAADLVGLSAGLSAAGAVIVGLAIAWKQAADEQWGFDKALLTTGQYAGKSSEDLRGLVDQLGMLDGVSRGSASDAVLKVAESGKFAGQQFDQVALSAAHMADATGQAIDKTVDRFKAIADDPVKALLKLNESEHFLTDAQYERISALVDEGQKQQAVAEAVQVYGNHLDDVASKSDEVMPAITKGWQETKAEISGAWSLLGEYVDLLVKANGIRLKNIVGPEITAFGEAFFNSLRPSVRLKSLVDEQKQAIKDAGIDINGVKATGGAAGTGTVDSETKEAEIKWREQTNRMLATTLDLEGKIKAMRADAAKAGITDAKLIADREAAIRAQDAKLNAGKGNGNALADATRGAGLAAIQNQAATEKAALESQTKVLQAQYQAREVSASNYYTQLRTLTAQGTNAEAAAIQKQIAYLQQQNVTGKDAVNVQKEIGKLEADLAKVRGDGAAKLQVLSIQERQAEQDRKDAIATYKAALQSSTAALEGQMQAMVLRVGLGDREYEVQQKVNDVYKEQARLLADLALQKSTGKIDADVAKANEANIKKEATAQVQAILEGYAALDKAQSDWKNGAAAAWMNYLTDANNVAGQMQSAFTGAFSGLEDAFVKFVQTGKLSFSDLANSIIADLARIEAKQAITGIFGSAFNAVLGSTIGGVSKEAIPVSSAFSLGGGRATGGDVVPGKLYPVGETGRPEILEQNGIKYLIPGAGGTVTPAGMAAVGGGGTGVFNVNIHNAPAGTTAEASAKQNANGGFDIAVILKAVRKDIANDLASGGTTMSAIKGRLDVKERV